MIWVFCPCQWWFPKKVWVGGGWVGGFSSIQFFWGFFEFFLTLQSPLHKHPTRNIDPSTLNIEIRITNTNIFTSITDLGTARSDPTDVSPRQWCTESTTANFIRLHLMGSHLNLRNYPRHKYGSCCTDYIQSGAVSFYIPVLHWNYILHIS